MTNDWQKSLEALRDTLPEGDATPEVDKEDTSKPSPQPRLDIILDKKGRKGKEATIVTGFTLSDAEVADVASSLKRRLGTGGSSRGGEILIQGDKRTQVLEALTSLGFKARII